MNHSPTCRPRNPFWNRVLECTDKAIIYRDSGFQHTAEMFAEEAANWMQKVNAWNVAYALCLEASEGFR